MESSLTKLIEMNASGLVMMACNAHDIWDPEQITKNKCWVVERIIDQMERDQVGVEALSKIMDEKVAMLNFHLDEGEELPQLQKTEVKPDNPPGPDLGEKSKSNEVKTPVVVESVVNNKQEEKEPPKPTKHYKSTDMPTKLAQERKPVKKLMMEDCVQLGLLTKKRANHLITHMAGKQPADAEKEVVKELRENLHKQVRNLIKKDKSNPWSSPKAQEELRLEIVNTPSVRSVLYLTKDIYRERDDWLNRSHNSITGRIFGSKMGLDKK
jgi:hypothetical protein